MEEDSKLELDKFSVVCSLQATAGNQPMMTRYDFPDEYDALMMLLLSLADQLTVHACLVIVFLLSLLLSCSNLSFSCNSVDLFSIIVFLHDVYYLVYVRVACFLHP